MAKLKILTNDIQSHQSSVDTLNDAGRKIIENDEKTMDGSATSGKLADLNNQWQNLQRNVSEREREIEDELLEAQNFSAELQELLSWLNDVDNVVGSTKPVGGLPETAAEQLAKFMEIHNEIEQNRTKV